MKNFVLLLFVVFCSFAVGQSLQRHPISTESELGLCPCKDTLSVLGIFKEYDIGIILPSWRPIVNDSFIAIVEGKIDYSPTDGRHGPHISHEEFPFYHYSHDLNFNIIPDTTPDNRFTNLLPYQVFELGKEKADTVLAKTVHVEWETGIGMKNILNPLSRLNKKGKSYGFYTKGHEMRDYLWNFPSIDDWAHVEGHYVWDRGHPPAYAELHPARLVAIRRNLPEKIYLNNQPERFAVRVDIFASGDGGVLKNNRSDVPDFVKRTTMSSKDYTFTITMNLPRPHPMAKLNFITIKHKGDDFSANEIVVLNDSAQTATFTLPWHSAHINDTAVFARTIYLYWEWGNGVPADYTIETIQVNLQELLIAKQRDMYGKNEYTMWANVGNETIFLNEFLCKDDRVLTTGISNTRKKDFKLSNSFTLYVPADRKFRVQLNGWESDGVEYFMGDLINPYLPCTNKTRRLFKLKLFSFNRMLMPGCVNDEMGEISGLHTLQHLADDNLFTIGPKDGINDDPCPFSKYPLKDTYFLRYTITKK